MREFLSAVCIIFVVADDSLARSEKMPKMHLSPSSAFLKHYAN
jgi:hypothetical protein